MKCAAEVLNIPPMELLLYNSTLGQRYLMTGLGYPPAAGLYAVENAGWIGVSDERFHELLFDTVYTRFLLPLTPEERADFKAQVEKDKPGFDYDEASTYGKYDFSAMDLIEPLTGTHCAGVKMIYEEDAAAQTRTVRQIVFLDKAMDELAIYPVDPAWGLGKIYVLQGAAYHTLFVVHPSLHFPFDSVNAITKSSVPMAHPLYQLLFPHTSYSLALNHSVLESAESVVNNNAQGTRFDPLTGQAYNLKLLFGAGYTGLSEEKYGNAYPPFNYMNPQMDFDSDYGRWLKDYFESAFMPLSKVVASYILRSDRLIEYTKRWADYNENHVLGFPDGKAIVDEETLAKALAIYTWDTSVSHGGDHDNFGCEVLAVEKCLRIRRAPPKNRDDHEVKVGEIFTGDDLKRASLANEMFFKPWAIKPNLDETLYAFTEPELWAATKQFHTDLEDVAERWIDSDFMLLKVPDKVKKDHPDKVAAYYARTIPQSIQY